MFEDIRKLMELVPIENTGYVWPTDPALIDPVQCSQFWDCDVRFSFVCLFCLSLGIMLFCQGHEQSPYEKPTDFTGWFQTDESNRPFASS
mmetsp:Transcript_41542/g.111365  ORF Transcript_41542/g.111365 Transcript_41542/m.111365 type:complete len:90 (+) Transcript_41542:48-317(+)